MSILFLLLLITALRAAVNNFNITSVALRGDTDIIQKIKNLFWDFFYPMVEDK